MIGDLEQAVPQVARLGVRVDRVGVNKGRGFCPSCGSRRMTERATCSRVARFGNGC